jgi:hypothetical protein
VRGFLRALGFPVLAFVLAEAVLALGAALCWQDPLRPATFIRWDSVRYLSIATRGYFIEEENGHVVDGNVAWFPGYPVAIRALRVLGLQAPRAGRLLSATAALALLIVIWNALLLDVPPDKRPILLLVAAFFPGFVYYHAVFPISLAATFLLLGLALAARGRFLAAGGFGALTAFTYSTGLLILPGLALAALIHPGLDRPGRLRALVEGAGVAACGFVGALAYEHRSVAWNAFSRMQTDYYGSGLNEPLTDLAWRTRHIWSREFQPELLIDAQAVLATLIVMAAAVLTWLHRRTVDRLHLLLLASGLVLWVAPHVVSRNVSAYRSEALLVGLVAPLGRLPREVLLVLLVLLVAMGFGMSLLFFESILV